MWLLVLKRECDAMGTINGLSSIHTEKNKIIILLYGQQVIKTTLVNLGVL